MNFNAAYPLADLKPADYNPRRITAEDFRALCKSISRFGMVKPVILNGDGGVLTAGHQRTKALKENGENVVPAIILKEISLHDEIKFNLFHNSVETNKTEVEIANAESLPDGYNWVPSASVSFKKAKNGSVIKEISGLLLRYGAWGSVVTDEHGKVILNSDYAVAHKNIANEDLLIYKMPAAEVEPFLKAINRNYGTYHYEALGIKAYNQLHCQMNRLRDTGNAKKNKSSTYENLILPKIKRGETLIDFGAGKMDYVKKLQNIGFKALGYEPHFQKPGSNGLDVKSVVGHMAEIYAHVKEFGAFDICVLDSVLNSVTTTEFETAVMTTCNALLNKDGAFYCGTRHIKCVESKMNLDKVRQNSGRVIEFLDNDNFSATFRNGVWTMQKFHSLGSLEALLKTYYHEVEVKDTGESNIYGVGRFPRNLSLDAYDAALNVEFNMEYPGAYRHNRQAKLVRLLLERLAQR